MKILKKVLAIMLIVSLVLTQSLDAIQYISYGETKTADTTKVEEKTKITELKQGKKNSDYELRGDNELIVKYKDETKKNANELKLKASKKLSKYETKRILTDKKINIIEVQEGEDVDLVIEELENDPNVLYVQPNYPLEILSAYSDDAFVEQWGMLNEGQEVQGKNTRTGVDINVVNAWNITKGSESIVIGVLDTGMDINHPDLVDNIYTNPFELADNGIDDDGNGYIDDVHGWDFAGDDAQIYDSEQLDLHGTYVAGIIAATENETGIIGVAPKVKVLPLKFINGSTGYTCDAIEAIEYAKAMGVKVINCSFGGTDNNQALKDAMQNSGILFITASGNRGGDVANVPMYPAAFDLSNIISVTSYDTMGVLSNFSSFGNSVDIAAPGTNVISTTPDGGYGYFNGTSVSAPFVSGVAALLMDQKKDITISEIKSRILNFARPSDALIGKVVSGGRLDAFGALSQTISTRDDYNGPNAGDDTLLNNGEGDGDTWYTQDQLVKFKEKIHYGEGGVNPASGNFSFSVTDMSVSSPGFQVNFSRTYNSRDEEVSLLGRGWTFGFEGSVAGTNVVEVKLPMGSTHRFTKDGSYYKAEDTRAKYVKNADGTSVLTTQDQYSYLFNASGFMTGMKDKNGNTLTITVDASGKVQSVTDTVGRNYNLQYNASGLIDNIKDPENRMVRYEYDTNNRLIKVVDPTGSVMNYGYDTAGYLTTVKDHYLNSIQNLTYSHATGDTQHKVINAIDSNGASWSYTYNMTDRKTTITDGGGRKWTYFFDASMYTIRVQDPEGNNEYTEYYSTNGANVYGDVRMRTDKYGNETLYNIDSVGNVTKIVYPDLSTESFVYDDKNNLIQKTNGNDIKTYFTYDSNKVNLLSETTVKKDVNYTEGVTPSSEYLRTTKIYYTKAEAQSLFNCNVAGLLKSIENPNGGIVTYSYDQYGNIASITDEVGRLTTYEYNAVGWKIDEISPSLSRTEYTYDANGMLIKTKYPDGGIARVVYDKVGRKIREISPNDYNASSDIADDIYTGNEGTQYQYYPSGNLEKIIYPNGGFISYTYDLYGNVSTEIKINGSVYRYVYDTLDRLKETYFKEDASSSEVKLNSYQFGKLDNGNWQHSETIYLNETETATTTSVYDFMGRLVETQYPNGAREKKEYNPDGTVSKEIAKNGAITSYVYDDFGRLMIAYQPMSVESDGTKYSYTSFVYDEIGNIIEKRQGKELVSFGDAYEPEVQVKDVVSTRMIYQPDVIETFNYYLDGKVRTQYKGNQMTRYTYDSNGNVSSKFQKIDDQSSQTIFYKNDFAGRKIEESYEVPLDELYSSDGYSDGIIKTQYSYDLNGNMVKLTKPDGSETHFSYDVMNRSTTVSEQLKDENGVLKTVTAVKAYDLSGNVISTIDAEENQTTFAYDAQNNLIKQVDAMGGINLYSYDRAGRRTAAVLPESFEEGKTISEMAHTAYIYDVMNQVVAVTLKYEKLSYNIATGSWDAQWIENVTKAYKYDNASRVIKELTGEGYSAGIGNTLQDRITSGYGVEKKYNLAGLLISVRDAATKQAGLSATITYSYDGLGRKISETNAKKNTVTYEYDDASNLIRSEIHGTVSSENDYGDANNLMRSKLNTTLLAENFYDGLGRVIETYDANDHSTIFRYNGMNKVSYITYVGDGPIESKFSSFKFDKLGNLTKEDEGRAVDEYSVYNSIYQDKLFKTTLTEYNDQSKPIKTTIKDSEGNIIQVTEKTYDFNGNVLTTKDPAGNITSNRYDKLNRLISTVSQISGVQRVSSFAYDLNGNKVTSTNWLGNTQTNVYDALNRLIERIDADGISTQKLEYNLDDAQIKSIDALNQVTTFKYDSNGRKVETINAEGNSERIDYDVLGNVIGKSDGLGNKTRYDYDALNHLKAVVNALGESTTYICDNNGNVLSQTDGNGHTTHYGYNARNLLSASMQPMDTVDYHNVTGYIYDYNGNLILTGKEYGNVILSDYDILNRLTQKKSGKFSERDIVEGEKFPIDVMESIDYSYDPNGNLLTMQDATGLTTWTYDEAGRALTKTVTGIGLSTYAYDLTSGIDSLMPGYRAEKTTDPLGGITLKVYDKVDRLVQVTDGGETTQFEYYPNGNRKSVTYPDGSKEVYTYNKIGQNTSLINLKADGTVIDTYSYTYDAAGNQTSKTDAKGITTFTYDKLNRLAEVTEPSGIKTTYSFDKAGNRISEKKYAGTSLLQDTSYSYDLANRLTQTQTKKNATSETEKTVYSYDISGNMVSQSKTTIKPAAIDVQTTFVLEKGKASADLVTLYAYDGFNQLKQSDDGINQITYAYNGFGLRTEKSVKAKDNPITTVTKYLYEGDKIILELDGSGNKIAKNIFGTNLLSREMAETKVYYMYNGHGDVTTLLNREGLIVGTYYYDAWGNILEKNESEQITNPYRYAGYQYDDETGLYYLNARYYDAKIARFLTEDTVTGNRKDPLSLNRYAYCHNDPIRYKDPTGHREELDKIIEESGSEAARIARKKLDDANRNWAKYNDQLANIEDKDSERYTKIKGYRDAEHDKAEDARWEYAINGVDFEYINSKYIASKEQSSTNKDTSKPLSNITVTRLTEEGFLPIMGDGILYYGGDQDWFSKQTQRSGGCGPTGAANILAYMALTNPELEKLYSGNINELNQDEFTKFMEEVYKYATPTEVPILNFITNIRGRDFIKPSLGVVSLWGMMIGIQEYAGSKNINLRGNIFDEAPTLENYVSYIRNGLSENKPIALLNLNNGIKMNYLDPKTGDVGEQDFWFHYVTITGLIENNQTGKVDLEISTWGGKATLNFNELFDQWSKGSVLDILTKPGMMYFDVD